MRIGIARIVIGLLQGLALAALWPAFNELMKHLQYVEWSDQIMVVPPVLMLLFTPVAFNAGLGRLRPVVLLGWTVAVAAICAGVGLNVVYAGVRTEWEIPRTALELMALLLIAQSLLAARGAQEGGYYQACFDAAWRHGLMLALSIVLTGIFWLVLKLGDLLFLSAGSDILNQLMDERYFWVTVTTTVFAAALHITDTRDKLTRGARTLALTLLSWLLPLLVALVAGFLVLLVINGVETLWRTKWAAFSTLSGAVLFVVLINTVYRDGRDDDPSPLILRWASVAGTVLLVPLVALAGYALLLRVRQYGWTVDRVLAMIVTGTGACYAAGYLASVLRTGVRMKLLERTNIVVALLIVGVLLALNSPLADPHRIAVNSQVARLQAGTLEPARFDFRYLTAKSGRYGFDGLRQLAATSEGPNAGEIARLAQEKLTAWHAYRATRRGPPDGAPTSELLPPEQRAQNITVVPVGGGALPDSFLQLDPAQHSWPAITALRECFVRNEHAACHAIILTPEQHGLAGILLISPASNAVAFVQDGAGRWRSIGRLENTNCDGVRAALMAGDLQMVQPQYPDLVAAGTRLPLDRQCPRAP